ncbi:MAG: hypothetical protein ACR2K2_14820 [Mycobacteriales bacterium]
MTAPKRTIPRAPNGLKAPGRSFWGAIVGAFELRADELRLLEAACRTLDDLTRLEAELAGSDLMVTGAAGQVRASPLVGEIRSHRDLLRKLTAQLRLPDAAGQVNTAAQPSRVRWDRRAVAAK